MGFELINDGRPLRWKDFEGMVLDDIEEVQRQRRVTSNPAEHSQSIYRGHASKDWSLETTLERFLKNDIGESHERYSAMEYYKYLSLIVPAISSLTSHRFAEFAPHEVELRWGMRPPHYNLLCFVRHHGFPTPLLDWTASYYVAAFFAFRSARADEDAAIFAYKEWNGEARGGWAADPIVHEHGPYVETHARHYKQQSRYTTCRAEIDEIIFFMNHQKAVDVNPDNHSIRKYVLHSGEKDKVLEMLFRMNINDYTLFGNEESLLRMLAYKEFREL